MTAITYINTHTQIPLWVNTVHADQQRGYAYELNGRLFHIYGRTQDLWIFVYRIKRPLKSPNIGIMPNISEGSPIMDPISFAEAEFKHKKKKNLRKIILEQTEKLIY